MKTSRLRSNFSRKHTHRIAKHKKLTKKRRTRFRRRKTSYVRDRTQENKKVVMQGGSSFNFKKLNAYDVYGNPVDSISYSFPMQWDD